MPGPKVKTNLVPVCSFRKGLFVIAVLGLAACSAKQEATVTTDITKASAAVTAAQAKAIQYYGIVKGAAIAAEAVNPGIKTQVDAILVKADAANALLTAAVPAATTDIAAVAAELMTDGNNLLLLVAPSVKVIGS